MSRLNSTYRLKLWTGWRDRLVDSVERLMGRSNRSSACPPGTWPRMRSPTRIPGSWRLRAAETTVVRRRGGQSSSDVPLSTKATKTPIDCLPPFAECRIKLESVELEKQAVVYGQESRCFSVEPVLRCLPGCVPVKTTSVTVGFHCVAAGEFTPASCHPTKSCWLHSHFFWPLRRFQCEQIRGSQRNPREEGWPEGKSWCSSGLQLHGSVCLNKLFICHVFRFVSKSFKIKFHLKKEQLW